MIDFSKLDADIQLLLWDGFRMKYCTEDSNVEESIDQFIVLMENHGFINISIRDLLY